jgi:hypothetical protein
VALQFVFDEVSGSIVDKVNGLVCAVKDTAPTYSQVVTGTYAGISPGILIGNTLPTHWGSFEKGTPTASLNVGPTDSMVLECWFANPKTTAGAIAPILSTKDAETAGLISFYFIQDPTNPKFVIYMLDDDGGTFYNEFAVPTSTFDGKPHKLRVSIDRGAFDDVQIDGVPCGDAITDTTYGHAYTNHMLRIGGGFDNNQFATGTFYELRWTIGNSTNV